VDYEAILRQAEQASYFVFAEFPPAVQEALLQVS
jgi:hypothetical protein